MLYLLFEIGADRYALPGSGIVAVEPMVRLKRIPRAVNGVAGVFNYHGRAVPVVDLSAMGVGRPSREDYFSTRIMVMADPGNPGRLLGVLAEKVTEMARFNEPDFQEPGVISGDAPYLGPVTHDSKGMIQRVAIDRLLTPEVRAVLWSQAAEAL